MTEKIYFKIGDVAEKFGVNTSLIRYWEQEFKFIKPRKSAKGTRLFTKKDIDHFEIIYHLIKEKGMTIQGAKAFLKNKKDDASIENLNVINTLNRTKNLLIEIKQILETKQDLPKEND
jgi:DNA-binding transcriptional MerR regulator